MGHLKGDECLHYVAGTLNDILNRPGDLLARYGGEEFIALLPETDSEGAVKVAERLREGVEAMKVEHSGSKISEFITVSLGVTTISPDGQPPLEACLESADKALYRAKEGGRNRVMKNE